MEFITTRFIWPTMFEMGGFPLCRNSLSVYTGVPSLFSRFLIQTRIARQNHWYNCTSRNSLIYLTPEAALLVVEEVPSHDRKIGVSRCSPSCKYAKASLHSNVRRFSSSETFVCRKYKNDKNAQVYSARAYQRVHLFTARIGFVKWRLQCFAHSKHGIFAKFGRNIRELLWNCLRQAYRYTNYGS